MADRYNQMFDLNDSEDDSVNYNDVDLFDLSRRRQQIETVRTSVDKELETEYTEYTDIEYNEEIVQGSSTGRRRKSNGSITGTYRDNGSEFGSDDATRYKKASKDENDTYSFNFNANKFVKFVLIAAVMCVIICMILVHSAVSKVNYAEVETGGNTAAASDAPDWTLRSESGITNILLLGIDGDGGSNQRSDTIMLLTLDEKNDIIKMTSILRDTYISIPGRDNKTRINHAYAYGGAALTMQTIESNFRIDIERYIGVDMDGLSVVVEKLGGVDMTLSAAEAKAINSHVEGSALTEGDQHLNGAQATYYARIRKIDSDFGRTGRQRKLIKAMLSAFKELGIVEQYNLISEAAPYLTTNYTEPELMLLALKMLGMLDADTDEMSVPVSGTYKSQTISGMAVLVPDLQKNCEEMHKFIFGSVPD